jgi:hypothetical protein
MFGPSCAGILGSAITWGYENTTQLASVGIMPNTVAGLDAHVTMDTPFDPDAAADAFMLVCVAEPSLTEPRSEVSQTMAMLAAIAAPDTIAEAIDRSARKFSTSEVFASIFKARLDEALKEIDLVNPAEVFMGKAIFAKPGRSTTTPFITEESVWEESVHTWLTQE